MPEPGAAPDPQALRRGHGAAGCARGRQNKGRPAREAGILVNALEELIILLLGSSPNPLPSRWHLQKELFMLAQVNPKLGPLIGFEPRYDGPYSLHLREVSLEPFRRVGAYGVDSAGRMRLTEAGRSMFDKKAADAGPQSRLASLLAAAEVIRMLYDRMSVEELLFLICDTYPEEADCSDRRYAFRDASVRRRLADSLLKKDLITLNRWDEMVADG